MYIRQAGTDDIRLIRDMAEEIWHVSFRSFISKDQIDYMLDLMYDPLVLERQMMEGHQKYLLIHEEEQYAGFASYEINQNQTNKTRLHKLFVLPELHKSGAGSLLLEYIIEKARDVHDESILLSVNRQNPAVDFYLNKGFEIIEEDDIPIGKGFVLRDFLLEYRLDD